MSSSDSTPTATPIATPEGSVYTPTTASSVSGLSFSQASLINQPLDTPYRDSALSPFEDTRSEAGSTTSTDDEAEAEWQESLHQLELLLSLLVIPFFGKWVGRRCAYWGKHINSSIF